MPVVTFNLNRDILSVLPTNKYLDLISMTVTLIAALTVDGFIARHTSERSFNWTSLEDKQFYVSQLKAADAIIMGATTFATFSRYPAASNWYIYTRSPEAFVNPKPAIITAQAVTEDPATLLTTLKDQGKDTVLVCGGSRIYTMFMQAGVVNKLLLTVEPVIFGEGVSLFDAACERQLQLLNQHRLSDQTTVFEYSVS